MRVRQAVLRVEWIRSNVGDGAGDVGINCGKLNDTVLAAICPIGCGNQKVHVAALSYVMAKKMTS